MKTLRRMFARLAATKRSRELGLELARHRIAKRGRILDLLYVDGYVRDYHGKRTIAKAYLTPCGEKTRTSCNCGTLDGLET